MNTTYNVIPPSLFLELILKFLSQSDRVIWVAYIASSKYSNEGSIANTIIANT